jgi:3-oxoadipyl-CoA thiolase
MAEAFICDFARTPIGRYGGVLSSVRTDDLAAIPIRALMERNTAVDWAALDEVILGCANQAGEDNRNVARMALLLAGLPQEVPGATVNRLCASGLDAVGTAARAIRLGEIDLAIAGGVESMSRAPFVMPKANSAFSRHAEIHDTTIGWRFINPALAKIYGTDSMPETAENVAREHNIARADQDAFALRSQSRAARAQANGFFAAEMVPVPVLQKRETVQIARDEHPRETSLEALAKLNPIHAGGSVTPGNASGINDGAAALLIASDKAVKRHNLKPRARITGMATAGVAPRVMGLGPVPATNKLLARLKLGVRDIDLWELNEAFAAQALACLRQLGIPDDSEHVNPNGGAIALGHPLGMSGARLALTAAHRLSEAGLDRAICTMCIGVGQGLALALERA